MSLPRPYPSHQTYMLTRRTLERRYFLNPDPQTALTLLFALAYYATRHDIKVHAFVFMSNHVHLVVTDIKGSLPDFTRDFYSSVARVMNKKLGRRENFWAAESGGATMLLDEHTVVEKVAYVLTNPVAGGAVPKHSRWKLGKTHSKTPIVSTIGAIKGKKRKRFSRPETYFKSKGSAVDDHAILILEPPPGIDEKQYYRDLEECVQAREKALQLERKATKKPFLGMENALNNSVHYIPPPKGDEEENSINPILACSDPVQLIEEKIKLKEWRRGHKGSTKKHQNGELDFPFPPGTYGKRKLYRIQIAPLEYVLRELSSP